MSISVTCPGCLTRFTVSDQFAGKEGPCPKCKTKIKIPKLEEQVVIHAPESMGPKDASGKSILKPIKRRETKISWPVLIGGVAACLLLPLAAALIGRAFPRQDGIPQVPPVLLGFGALGLAPILVWTLYEFLRNVELEGYRSRELWLRVGICSVVYAALWGLHLYLKIMLLEEGERPEMMHMLMILPAMFVPGVLTAMATLDLDGLNSALHYGGYLVVTVLLRLAMGIGPF